MNSFFAELKRRNVVRVAIAYAVVSWVVIQVGDIAAENLNFPEWFIPMVFVVLGIGFPLALIISWAFEMTPEGLKKTAEVDASKSITHGTGQKINYIIITGLVLAVVFLLYDRTTLSPTEPQETVAEAEAGTSIAVMPFVNMSNDPDQDFFSDGISEEILNVLVRVDGLSVASRTSAFAYKGQTLSLSEIAGELNVDNILEGSVRKFDNRVRITAQLIDTKTDRHLWSETYDRELVDIFAIQDEISNAIVNALKETLGVENLEAVSVKRLTDNMSAYELYLKGRELFISRDDLPESVRLLEAAVEIDPNFAQAWETLGAAYAVYPYWGLVIDRDYLALADQAAFKALELDENLSMAYAVLGSNKAVMGREETDWLGAMEDYNRAIENDNKNTTAWLWRGIAFRNLGFFDKSIEDIDKCIEIDPAYKNCVRHLAWSYAFKENHAKAVDLYNKGLETNFLNSEDSFVYSMLKTGNRTGALLLADRATGGTNAPIGGWIRALENPEAISPKDLNDYQKWLETHTINENSPYAFFMAFKDFTTLSLLTTDVDYHWSPEGKDWRQSEGFKGVAKRGGFLDYWNEKGWPPQCQPIGQEDFTCE